MEIESAVRIPSPEPERSRKRSPPSRSPSPRRYRSPPRGRSRSYSADGNDRRQLEHRPREPEPPKPLTEEQKQAFAKAEYEKLVNMRSGGTYIPPARLRALQAQITDKTSKEYQRMAWEALKKSINGLINKVNVSNIKYIVPELFNENLVRGRGLFCRSIMKAQAASLPFTPIYAAMAAIVNTKLPQVGELLATRLVVQFRKAFKRNDKAVCLSSTTFIAHLVNQQVIHETLAAQILLLLLHKPTDDSVEIAVGFTREVGQHLEEMSQPIALAVFDQFRTILHEADIDKRTQYMVEVLFQVRKDRYKDNPAVKEELDLVEEEDQITHRIGLDDDLEVQDGLNIFKFDSEWQEHEDAYKQLKAEILGEAEGSDDEEYETDDSSDGEEEKQERELEIKDQTNTDLVNLRRTIYLTIKSSGGFEECCHKLMKINLPPGQESELPSMIIECASQERTYDKFYGLIAERFSKLNRFWRELFEESFVKYFTTIHRYETNRLRIIAQIFAHLLASDAIGWHVFSVIQMNEEDTSSSSRIFIKILFEELAQAMGMKKLAERMREDTLQPEFDGIFPKDDSRKTRFAINFFTAIGMGVLTEDMREYLKNLPKPAPPPALPPADAESDSESVSSYSSYSSYSSRSRSPVRSRRRRDSFSESRSPSPRGRTRSRSYSYTPPRRRARSDSLSVSRSRSPSYTPPPRRRRDRSYTESISRSPAPRRRATSSLSRTPPKRNGRRSPSRSISRSLSPAPRGTRKARSISRSRSRSPYQAPARSRRDRSYTYSRSPSRSPVGAGKGKGRSHARSLSRSLSRSRSPLPRRRSSVSSRGRDNRDRGFQRGGDEYSRRRNTSSPEDSPPPRRRVPSRSVGPVRKDREPANVRARASDYI
ncbi:pre-mRNA-splicing factor cwc22 [Phyllosticta citribraziliensis]|uniref:Pre-mRNA-splicing factor cwc22 n=1 Tax=Phyllosticta citribraziliensis TaxID=989973 RepID=A0ABR1LTM2_9PEZI